MTAFTCDSCDHTHFGSLRDILQLGWRKRILKGGRDFWMCGDCEVLYAERRRQARTRAA